ncbi:MAG: SEL1-like repeat protein [Woeseiaceae bacterium]|nr:SEL1-like repeat protein [Woeseiaceae bacterium]
MIARIGITLVLLFALAGGAVAQWADYPAGPIDSKTLRSQSKAEILYERGDFKRALFIYEKELAGTGDKYAQYMTGYMYLMGQGAPADPVLASAWYRLAAERNAPEFIAVRDQLLGTMNDGQRAQSDRLYIGLRKELSDVVLIMNLMLADLKRLDSRTTGSRLGGSSSPVTIIDPQTGIPISAAHYESRIRDIVQTRLDFVTARLDIDELDADLSGEQIDSLWERINDYVSVVNDDGDVFVGTR